MTLLERDGQLRAADGYLADAAAGHGRLVFVGGEAGVGKTAFVQALASGAGRARGDRLVRRLGDAATARPAGRHAARPARRHLAGRRLTLPAVRERPGRPPAPAGREAVPPRRRGRALGRRGDARPAASPRPPGARLPRARAGDLPAGGHDRGRRAAGPARRHRVRDRHPPARPVAADGRRGRPPRRRPRHGRGGGALRGHGGQPVLRDGGARIRGSDAADHGPRRRPRPCVAARRDRAARPRARRARRHPGRGRPRRRPPPRRTGRRSTSRCRAASLRRIGDDIVFRHELARLAVAGEVPAGRAVHLHRRLLAALRRRAAPTLPGSRTTPRRAGDVACRARPRPGRGLAVPPRSGRTGRPRASTERALRPRRRARRRRAGPAALGPRLRVLPHRPDRRVDRCGRAGARDLGRARRPVRVGDAWRCGSRLQWFAGRNDEAEGDADRAVDLLDGDRHGRAGDGAEQLGTARGCCRTRLAPHAGVGRAHVRRARRACPRAPAATRCGCTRSTTSARSRSLPATSRRRADARGVARRARRRPTCTSTPPAPTATSARRRSCSAATTTRTGGWTRASPTASIATSTRGRLPPRLRSRLHLDRWEERRPAPTRRRDARRLERGRPHRAAAGRRAPRIRTGAGDPVPALLARAVETGRGHGRGPASRDRPQPPGAKRRGWSATRTPPPASPRRHGPRRRRRLPVVARSRRHLAASRRTTPARRSHRPTRRSGPGAGRRPPAWWAGAASPYDRGLALARSGEVDAAHRGGRDLRPARRDGRGRGRARCCRQRVRRVPRATRASSHPPGLTRREQEVLALLSAGSATPRSPSAS